MSKEFVEGLLEKLREYLPDLTFRRSIDGFGRRWEDVLYSEEGKLFMEVFIGRRGGASSFRQDKFRSIVLKLIDIAVKNRDVKPVLLWNGTLAVGSQDVNLCSKWGVYVISSRNLEKLKDVVKGASTEEVNASTLSFLLKKSEVSRSPWLIKARREAILSFLSQEPRSEKELSDLLNVDRVRVRGDLYALLKECRVVKLMSRMPRHGALWGTDRSQKEVCLSKFLKMKVGSERKKAVLKGEILKLLNGRDELRSVEVVRMLSEKLGIKLTLHIVQGLLKVLEREGKVQYVRLKGRKGRWFSVV